MAIVAEKQLVNRARILKPEGVRGYILKSKSNDWETPKEGRKNGKGEVSGNLRAGGGDSRKEHGLRWG
jgi:hypothetical protein